MVIESQTTIKIGSKEISDYKHLTIDQAIDSHHKIELVLHLRSVEKGDLMPEPAAFAFDSKKFLGEKISIKLNTKALLDTEDGLEFRGIVTEVRNVKGTSDFTHDEVRIIAHSPTILMDDGPNYTSFLDMSLTEVVDRTLIDYGDDIGEYEIGLMDDAQIKYSVQCNESAFEYLRRLAAQYGEWFYYNGTKIIFGKPEEEEVKLKRSFDLKTFDISMRPISNNYKYFSSDYLKKETPEKKTSETDAGAEGYGKFVNDKSAEIYTKETTVWNNIGADEKVEEILEKNTEKQKKAFEINQVVLTGISDNPCIKVGNIVIIESNKYRVLSIQHRSTKEGEYENHFRAITADYDAYPYTDINAFPKTLSQHAVIVENEDPEGIGRVKVKFPWMHGKQVYGEDLVSPWIRIATPHGGSDKGFQFIPEVDEEVIVGFVGGNAEQPYMIGSLYHGKAKPDSWTKPNNDMKAIKTRSGHKIEFNDQSGSETITIMDASNNMILIDTAASSITISAPSQVNINASKINLNGTDIKITASNDLTLSAGNEYAQSSGVDTSVTVGGSMNVEAQTEVLVSATAKIGLAAKLTEVAGEASVKVVGKMVDIEGEAMTNVKGGIVNLNC